MSIVHILQSNLQSAQKKFNYTTILYRHADVNPYNCMKEVCLVQEVSSSCHACPETH